VGPSGWLGLRTSVLDRIVAIAALPLLGPVIAALAWRVRRADGPPAFVRLERVGRGGKPFGMWKLRSMRAEAADGTATGSAITGSDDARVTPVGAWLRRHRIDELPQIWNVARGEMALLGPRPETPSMVDFADPRWRDVLAVRPGVAGPTQLVIERWEAEALTGADPSARYAREILPVKLAVDAWYVRSASPWTDLQVGWSMLEHFVLRRDRTAIEGVVRDAVGEVAAVPSRGLAGG
jgi:lipopolysaccharide/colanic/teichoic acid biosynthesis glycosyltransferase